MEINSCYWNGHQRKKDGENEEAPMASHYAPLNTGRLGAQELLMELRTVCWLASQTTFTTSITTIVLNWSTNDGKLGDQRNVLIPKLLCFSNLLPVKRRWRSHYEATGSRRTNCDWFMSPFSLCVIILCLRILDIIRSRKFLCYCRGGRPLVEGGRGSAYLFFTTATNVVYWPTLLLRRVLW